MSRWPIIVEAEAAEMVALYRSGLSICQVAERVGRSETGVRGILVRAGVRMRPVGAKTGSRGRPSDASVPLPSWHPSLPDADECSQRFDLLPPRQRQIIGLLARGWEPKGIARQLGITQNTVYNHLNSAAETLEVRPPMPAVVALYYRAQEASAAVHELRELRAS